MLDTDYDANDTFGNPLVRRTTWMEWAGFAEGEGEEDALKQHDFSAFAGGLLPDEYDGEGGEGVLQRPP